MGRYSKPTKPLGWLYVIRHSNGPDQVKIGITDRPVARMQELDNPEILARVPVMKPREKEQLLHDRYGPQRMPQTEYFRLDAKQLESVLNACTSWMAEVQQLIVEPSIPESPEPEEEVVRAEPLNGFPEPGEDLREFIERPAKERREALEERAKRKAEAEESHRQWLKKAGIRPLLPKEERLQREREEYQAWLAEAEKAARSRLPKHFRP